jgi:hypothetical protein
MIKRIELHGSVLMEGERGEKRRELSYVEKRSEDETTYTGDMRVS